MASKLIEIVGSRKENGALVVIIRGEKGEYEKGIYDASAIAAFGGPGKYFPKWSKKDNDWQIVGLTKESATVTVPGSNGATVMTQVLDPNVVLREKATTFRQAAVVAGEVAKAILATQFFKTPGDASGFVLELTEKLTMQAREFVNGGFMSNSKMESKSQELIREPVGI